MRVCIQVGTLLLLPCSVFVASDPATILQLRCNCMVLVALPCTLPLWLRVDGLFLPAATTFLSPACLSAVVPSCSCFRRRSFSPTGVCARAFSCTVAGWHPACPMCLLTHENAPASPAALLLEPLEHVAEEAESLDGDQDDESNQHPQPRWWRRRWRILQSPPCLVV